MNTVNVEKIQRDYLQAVLLHLDACLEREVYCWQLAGQDPSDRFRGLHISDSEAIALSRLLPGEHWGSNVSISDSENKRLTDALAKADHQIKQLEDQAEKDGISLRLVSLEKIFGLSKFEWWAFVVCLAPALDLRYERIYGYLQDDVTRVQPTVDLILSLLLPEGLSRLDSLSCFEPNAPLRQYRLLIQSERIGQNSNNLRQAFQVAPSIISWLLGAYSPQSSGNSLEYSPLTKSTPDEWDISVFDNDNMPSAEVIDKTHPLLSFSGDDLFKQELVAQQLASALKKPLLKLKVLAESTIETALDQLYPAVRDARMLGALLSIENFDVFIDHDGCLIPAAFTALHLTGYTVLINSKQPFRLSDEMPGNDYPLMHIFLDGLTTTERADLWSAMLDGVSDQPMQETIQTLAGQFKLTTGQIVASASTAMSFALQAGRSLESDDLFEAARFHSGHHLAGLAHKIEPRYSWEDLVLPETPINMLHEMVSMVKSRPRVLEEWGLGRKLTSSMGISSLFTGSPGTGKTLAAQIIAHELGIDLFRIDLSTVVSKYIGETEKNLERIFNEAQASNAILFFDEADAIFGKRSEVKDAHDRYANIEVGYLLQRMEAYDGVAILATNLRANLDEAFTRRLQFIINFPFPEEEYRERIWKVLMPPEMPRANDLDLGLMARRFKLAGGSIRNSIVSAAFLAAEDSNGCVGMNHLMHGVRRELQKMGKLVQETDFVLSQDEKGD
jgi:hypothetical protein